MELRANANEVKYCTRARAKRPTESHAKYQFSFEIISGDAAARRASMTHTHSRTRREACANRFSQCQKRKNYWIALANNYAIHRQHTLTHTHTFVNWWERFSCISRLQFNKIQWILHVFFFADTKSVAAIMPHAGAQPCRCSSAPRNSPNLIQISFSRLISVSLTLLRVGWSAGWLVFLSARKITEYFYKFYCFETCSELVSRREKELCSVHRQQQRRRWRRRWIVIFSYTYFFSRIILNVRLYILGRTRCEVRSHCSQWL